MKAQAAYLETTHRGSTWQQRASSAAAAMAGRCGRAIGGLGRIIFGLIPRSACLPTYLPTSSASSSHSTAGKLGNWKLLLTRPGSATTQTRASQPTASARPRESTTSGTRQARSTAAARGKSGVTARSGWRSRRRRARRAAGS